MFLPSDVHAHLQARATSKWISASSLITALIQTIDKDDLYEAVLDDGLEPDRPWGPGRQLPPALTKPRPLRISKIALVGSS